MISSFVRNVLRQSISVKLLSQHNNQNISKLTRSITSIQGGNLLINRKIRNDYVIYSQNISKTFYSLEALQYNNDYCKKHNITVIGKDVPDPIIDYKESDLPDDIKEFLTTKGFQEPTFIQAQGWPIALSGQNLVGIAQTGTGKTLAFLVPAVIQLMEKKSKSRNPSVLVIAPTRELAKQIEQVAMDFQKKFRVRCVCVYGGASKNIQLSKIRAGVDILVATPGRLNDFIDMGVISLESCTYVVLDEADRMLNMGFEPQIRQILSGVPRERQTLMFSATWPEDVRHLASDYLGDFVQINVGSTELSANKNIKQYVHICESNEKMDKLKSVLNDICENDHGKIIIFANTKLAVDNLEYVLNRDGKLVQGIHGDKSQLQRDSIISRFKNGNSKILVATDVASRGLDVSGVTHVINFDFPPLCEDYVHRIGRTGRQDNKGESHCIFTQDDGSALARSLINVLKEANQEVPQELKHLARGGFTKLMPNYQSNRRSFNRSYKSGYSGNRNRYSGSSEYYEKNDSNRNRYPNSRSSGRSWY